MNSNQLQFSNDPGDWGQIVYTASHGQHISLPVADDPPGHMKRSYGKQALPGDPATAPAYL